MICAIMSCNCSNKYQNKAMTSDSTKDINRKWYLDSVLSSLNNCFSQKWKQDADTSVYNVIAFTIFKNGTVKNYRIKNKSISPVFDSVTMSCLKEMKLSPLPDKFEGDSLNINVHFKNYTTAFK